MVGEENVLNILMKLFLVNMLIIKEELRKKIDYEKKQRIF